MSAPRDPEVLEQNLSLLLRRAYLPALPGPEFRARLRSRFLAEVQRLARRRRSLRPRPLASPARLAGAALAAAAALLGLFLLRGVLGEGRPADRAELLAGGHVAVRRGAEAWRAAEAAELDGALRPGGAALAVATPEERGIRIELAGGAAELAPASELSLAQAATTELRLHGGAVALTRAPAPGTEPWALATEQGHVALHEGRLSVAVDPGAPRVELRLEAGSAAVLEPGGARALAPGGTHALSGGRLVEPPAGPSVATAPSERRALAPDPEPEEEAAAGEPSAPESTASTGTAGPGRVAGTVRLAEDEEGAELPDFVVGLLPLRAENEPTFATPAGGDPRTGRFEATGVELGELAVFVHAEGYAMAHAGRFRLSAGAPEARFEATLSRGGSLRGTVVDAAGGPVAGAFVRSQRDAPASGLPFHEAPEHGLWLPIATHTRADGGFELPHLSPGEHVLLVSAPGHAPVWIGPIAIAEGARVEGVRIELGVPGAIEGLVTDAAGGPVAGVQIVAFLGGAGDPRGGCFSVVGTDAEGRYAFADLPAGQLLVILTRAGGAAPRVLPAVVKAGATTRVDFLGEASGTRLSGVLRDREGRPVRLQNLACFSREGTSRSDSWVATTTGPEGEYVFEGLEPGAYLVYHVGAMGGTLYLVAEVDVPATPTLELDLVYGPCALEGRVSAAATDAPLADTILVLERFADDGELLFGGLARTDAEGLYAFASLPAGRYALTAYPTDGVHGFGHEPAFDLRPQEGAEGAEDGLALDFPLYPGGGAVVTVVDDAGRPVEGATVVFVDDLGHPFTFAEEPLTDARGRHVARGIRPGRYRVRAERAGHADASLAFDCREGVTQELRIELRRAGEGPGGER